jgi:hypothetical protein
MAERQSELYPESPAIRHSGLDPESPEIKRGMLNQVQHDALCITHDGGYMTLDAACWMLKT